MNPWDKMKKARLVRAFIWLEIKNLFRKSFYCLTTPFLFDLQIAGDRMPNAVSLIHGKYSVGR